MVMLWKCICIGRVIIYRWFSRVFRGGSMGIIVDKFGDWLEMLFVLLG